MKKITVLPIVLQLLFLFSCESKKEVFDPVYSFQGKSDEKFEISNLNDFEVFVAQDVFFKEKIMSEILSDSVYDMGAVFKDLFLNKNPCSIPSDIKSKLKAIKNWVPKNFPKAIPTKARKASGEAVIRFLNRLTVIDASGSERLIQVEPIFKSIPIFMVDPTTTTNAGYNIDCSGYLNAALEAQAKAASKAEIKVSAEANLTKEGGLSVIYGLFNPPVIHFMGLANSMHPEVIRKYRLDYLVALKIAMLNATTTEYIKPLLQIEAINVANNAKSNYNGQTDLSAGVNFGASIDLSSGFSVQKSIYYSDFDTYVTDDKQLELNTKINLSDIHTHLQLAFREAQIIENPKIENTYTVLFSMIAPNTLENWKVKGCANCTVTTQFDKPNQIISFRITYPNTIIPRNTMTLQCEKWSNVTLEKTIPLI